MKTPRSFRFPASLASILLLAAIALSGPAAAASEAYDEARALGAEVEALLQADRVEAALRLARTAAARPWNDRRAQLQAHYSCAWTLAQVARGRRSGSEAPADLWREAARHYSAVLRVHPDFGAAIEGLVETYEALGATDRSLRVLDGAIRAAADPAVQARWLIRSGDLERARGRVAEAWSFYRQAEVADPASAGASQRVIELYATVLEGEGKGIDLGPRDLLEICLAYEKAGKAEPALEGYEAILHFGRRYPEEAAFALGHWVDLRTQSDSLALSVARRLPNRREWNDLALETLRALLEQPAKVERIDFSPWTETAVGADRLARTLHALAREVRAQGAKAGPAPEALALAEQLLSKADSVAPSADLYEPGAPLAGRSIVRLEVALDQALLYKKHRSLDPEGMKFERMENRLISEKNQLYRQWDLQGMQQYHSILGLIYADPAVNRWESGIRGAPYHLERAVDFAQRLEADENAVAKPLPHLLRVHAAGLEKSNQPTEARALYLEASKSYLQSGDLRVAEDTLQEATRIETRHRLDPSVQTRALQEVLDLRLDLQKASPTTRYTPREVEAERARWASLSATLGADFVQAQARQAAVDLVTRAAVPPTTVRSLPATDPSAAETPTRLKVLTEVIAQPVEAIQVDAESLKRIKKVDPSTLRQE